MNNLIDKANPKEIIDLVDENDVIIGEIDRDVANSNPDLYHREVGVLILDDQKRVLMQKRSTYKKINPSMWSICAGHILKGDDIEKTAHRELQEEYGFDLDLTFYKKELHIYPQEKHFTYFFLGNYAGQEFILEPAEVEEVRFFSYDELMQAFQKGERINEHYFGVIGEVVEGSNYLKNN